MSGGSMNYFYRKLLWECDFEETTPMRVAFSRHLLKVAVALKAIEWVDSGDRGPGDEDEPIAEVLGSTNRGQRMRDAGYTRRPTVREMSEPEQEPVAWMWDQQARRSSTGIGGWDKQLLFCRPAEDPSVPKRNITPLYTHPPRRAWRSLSEEEIATAAPDEPFDLDFAYARAIEAALRSKNT